MFPPPGADELALLRARLPEVSAANVRLIPADVVTDIMARAVATRGTYMDLLTDGVLRTSAVYYLPVAGLTELDRTYATGALPYSGKAKDGRPFRMIALAAGANRVDFVYDRLDEFEFVSETGSDFKVLPGGHVSAAIAGPGVLADIKGAKVYGCSGLCAWASFLKWQKEGDTLRVTVKAFGSTKDKVVPLQPVRAK